MILSAKSTYALKATLELSKHWPNTTPLPIADIAKRQGIPLTFLTQILLVLKQHGLVESIRGKHGGYVLRQKPNKITLAHILGIYVSFEVKGRSIFHRIANDVGQETLARLKQVNFEDIIKQERDINKIALYTI